MGWGFRSEPKTGSFPAEGWLFILGTLARSERNGGFFRADYAITAYHGISFPMAEYLSCLYFIGTS
jgi:hypothetical protein